MGMDPDVRRLLEAVGEDGTDADVKRIAADACLDAGKPAWAECLRWAADTGRRPILAAGDDCFRWMCGACGSALFLSDLPQPLLAGVLGCVNVGPDAADAWLYLLGRWEEARAGGWVPPLISGERFTGEWKG